jgi:hypothetical protein
VIDAADGPGDRLEPLPADRRAAHVAGAVRVLVELVERPSDVGELRVELLRGVNLRDALDGLGRALADALAERHGAHRIAGSGGEGSELVLEQASNAFERAADPFRLHADQTPSMSGSPPCCSTWPLPSVKIVGAASERRRSSSL